MPRDPDRPLRRLVADLAARPADDVEAVLAALAPPVRRRTEALIAEARGRPVDPAPEGTAHEGLSPWLAARVRGDGPDQGALTPQARAALRNAAAEVRTRAAAGPQPLRRRAGLFDLATRWLEQRRS